MNFSEWRKFQQLRESSKNIDDIFNEFILYVKKFLNLKKHPKIIFVKDGNFASKINAFGVINGSNIIHIETKNRQPMDIIRTIAHELVHYHQHEQGIHGNGNPGSPTENQANAIAGEIVRRFGQKHSNLFNLKSLT